jgi:hypothetical protein
MFATRRFERTHRATQTDSRAAFARSFTILVKQFTKSMKPAHRIRAHSTTATVGHGRFFNSRAHTLTAHHAAFDANARHYRAIARRRRKRQPPARANFPRWKLKPRCKPHAAAASHIHSAAALA